MEESRKPVRADEKGTLTKAGGVCEKRGICVRGLTLGSGIPKICVPVSEATEEAILCVAAQAARSEAQILEWRADCYEGAADARRTVRLAVRLRQTIGDMPLLFTYRTRAEGGAAKRELSPEEYLCLNRRILEEQAADILDLELRAGERAVREMAKAAHENGCYLLASSHDFAATPPAEELLSRFRRMEEWGVDILKLAVMPENTADVLTLLGAGATASARTSRPVIAISMGVLGMESRVCCEAFGSAMTFGCLGRSSAPGQMEAAALARILKTLHEARRGKTPVY